MNRSRRRPGARSVPALYGALTAGLLVLVLVVASVVSPATPPSIAELSPSARERIEEARDEQGVGSGEGARGQCAPDDVACIEAKREASARRRGSESGIPPVEVAAGRRCFGHPPRQTEDPHSPPCVFEIFKGDNGGATTPGVTGTEIRVAFPATTSTVQDMVKALIAHFNSRYEFYGRRLTPVFVSNCPTDDPSANRAFADELAAEEVFAGVFNCSLATNAVIYRRLAEAGIVSAVSLASAFSSDAVTEGMTWLVDPPLDVRLRAGAAFVCRALNDRPARHAGPGSVGKPRKFAVVALTEAGATPDPGPLQEGLRGCGADFETFEAPMYGSTGDYEPLMLQLKQEDFTTVIIVGPFIFSSRGPYQAATNVNYFPEWFDIGLWSVHKENFFAGSWRGYTAPQAEHAFGITSDSPVRPDAEEPSVWAYWEGGGKGTPNYSLDPYPKSWYQGLLLLASGIQGAEPNLTPESFSNALRTKDFPNPNPGAPPYWQQGIGFGLGDFIFHSDYAAWWWNDNAPSQTNQSYSGKGSFCYLDRGARFTADSFPANADSRLFSASEPCR